MCVARSAIIEFSDAQTEDDLRTVSSVVCGVDHGRDQLVSRAVHVRLQLSRIGDDSDLDWVDIAPCSMFFLRTRAVEQS